jgi:hypothetical protein
MGSWVRTITTPFRKACTIFGPQKDGGKKTQQPNSGQFSFQSQADCSSTAQHSF